jgi:hypothetical protein
MPEPEAATKKEQRMKEKKGAHDRDGDDVC